MHEHILYLNVNINYFVIVMEDDASLGTL